MKEIFKIHLFNKANSSNRNILLFLKKRILRQTFILLLSVCHFLLAQAQYEVIITTNASTPANTSLKNYVLSGRVTSNVVYNPGANSFDTVTVLIYGKITSQNLTITTTQTNMALFLQKGMPISLSPMQLSNAFGNFDPPNLNISGPAASNIDPNNIVLPDGNYQICFWAIKTGYCPPPIQCYISNPNLGCSSFNIACSPINGSIINTRANNPISPVIAQAIQLGNISATIQFNATPGCTPQVRVFGKLERISPSPFTIQLNQSFPPPPVTINPGITQLTSNQMLSAFGNFDDGSLLVTGINLASIKDANNRIKLPDGNYRICLYAKYFNDVNASDPNLGCASFTLCNKAGGAPQFIQPVNNVNANSDFPIIQPVSPVVFSWTPPQSTCGLPPSKYIYDLEIWELNPNQNVNDAINNPYVFQKRSLPSTIFLLDLNLNKDVLKTGKRYAMRVRAAVENANPNSPVEIENDGYSRVEAFQYGTGIVPPPPLFEPKNFFIEFKERKSSYWDDVKRRGHDTLVPIKEYIAFVLTQNGIGYGEDAIEMFIALNPELAEMKKVKMSYVPNLPVFPSVSASDEKKFNKEHETNLEPNKEEENKFLRYLDTLNNQRPRIPEKAVSMINDLVRHLNSIKPEISSVDRVTVNYINQVLAEFLFQLRIYSGNSSNIQYNQLQRLATTLRELTIDSLDGSSFIWPGKNKVSVSSNQSGPNQYPLNITTDPPSEEDIEFMPLNLIQQLLPYDVVVWRPGSVAPYKPVFDAPDLKTTFRIYYTLSNLYNHRNPEVNAKSSTRLASTVQVSLPSNSTYSFWTLNMVNHKMTTAEDVDLRDVYKKNMKMDPGFKKLTVVIKVE